MRNPVSDATLAQARAINEATMRDTCEVRYRPATPNPDYGGVNTDNDATWNKLTGVKCRVKEEDAQERVVGQGATQVARYRVSVPLGTVVGHRDRIVVNGLRLEVVAVADLGSYRTSIRLTCQKVG
jgi:hypothetical protein